MPDSGSTPMPLKSWILTASGEPASSTDLAGVDQRPQHGEVVEGDVEGCPTSCRSSDSRPTCRAGGSA
ncbi:hypothetical protein GGE24_006854 [Bradyrhizobium centrosematis]|nr:hypothetical protein [Bradyrhizobium centrosematis]MCS3777498.1 hypothetical protein [Bradyrhizobium centrosematis]